MLRAKQNINFEEKLARLTGSLIRLYTTTLPPLSNPPPPHCPYVPFRPFVAFVSHCQVECVLQRLPTAQCFDMRAYALELGAQSDVRPPLIFQSFGFFFENVLPINMANICKSISREAFGQLGEGQGVWWFVDWFPNRAILFS